MSKSLLQEKYEQLVTPQLMKDFQITNRHRVPKIVKVVVNTSIKEAVQDSKIIDIAANELSALTGQRVVVTRAKKSISNFKLRAGQPIGCCVTLRRDRMYDFVLRLFSVALPRVRDFKGVSPRGFDRNGNFTMGLTEQVIFPEVDLNKVTHTFGMNITFVTTAHTDEEGRRLLELLGMPFRKPQPTATTPTAAAA